MHLAVESVGGARAGRHEGGLAREQDQRGDPVHLAGTAKIFRRHRRGLLCPLRHLAHGTRKCAMNYSITHRTLYEYAAPVTTSHHVARLEPRSLTTQAQENFTLKIFPEPALRKARADYFGNRLCLFSVQEVHSKLEIITHSRVTVTGKKLPAPGQSPAWGTAAQMFRDPDSPEVVEPHQFTSDSP